MVACSFIRGCLHVSLGLWVSAYWYMHVVLCPLNRIDMTRVVKEGEKGKEYGLDSVSCPGRRVIRSMKRKHDDINHIQKVRV